MWLGEPVVLPDQLVGTVVFIGNGGRPLSDRDYVPIVIVCVFIGLVAVILITEQKEDLGSVGLLSGCCQKNRLLSP